MIYGTLPSVIDRPAYNGEVVLRWYNGDHAFNVVRMAPRVFLTRGVGVMSGDVMDLFIALLDRELERGTREMVFFHDWERIESYEPAMRQKLTDWRRRAPAGATSSIHVLVRSKLLAMGVSASAIVLRLVGLDVHSYSERAAFDRALDRALKS